MKILLAEDDESITRALKLMLEKNKYTVDLVFNGADALEHIVSSEYDALVLDIMMPGLDGIEVLTAARSRGVTAPALFLTAKGEDSDKVLGLNIGADDYITKPFNPIEVLARVKSQLRRYTTLGGKQSGDEQGVLRNGALVLDDAAKMVRVDGEVINLTPIEYNILHLLMKNPGRVYSTAQIYQLVWNDPVLGSENTVAVHIRHLREKIEIDPANPHYLKVVWGLGYKMEKMV